MSRRSTEHRNHSHRSRHTNRADHATDQTSQHRSTSRVRNTENGEAGRYAYREQSTQAELSLRARPPQHGERMHRRDAEGERTNADEPPAIADQYTRTSDARELARRDKGDSAPRDAATAPSITPQRDDRVVAKEAHEKGARQQRDRTKAAQASTRSATIHRDGQRSAPRRVSQHRHYAKNGHETKRRCSRPNHTRTTAPNHTARAGRSSPQSRALNESTRSASNAAAENHRPRQPQKKPTKPDPRQTPTNHQTLRTTPQQTRQRH